MTTILNASSSSGLVAQADTSGILQLQTASTAAVTITAGQLVGIGTASPNGVLSVKTSAGRQLDVVEDGTSSDVLMRSVAPNSGNNLRQVGLAGTYISMNTGSSSGTTYTERMRIDSSGNVGIGTASPTQKLEVVSTTNAQGILVSGSVDNVALNLKNTGASGKTWGIFSANTGSGAGGGALGFFDGTAYRMIIVSSGAVRIGSTASSPAWMVIENPNNISGSFNTVTSLGSNCNNTSSYHLLCATGGADKLYILGNGNVQNVNNSYGALSDAKLKENIVDATPKLDDLMKVKVRNYNLKSDPDQKQIGVIAQELEQVFPAMVEEAPDMDSERNILETTTKSVKYSVFVPMLIKAIQEQQALITQLQADVAALKGAK